jgi:hypothetical protein
VPEGGLLKLAWDNYGAPWRLERLLTYTIHVYYSGSDNLKQEHQVQYRENLLNLSETKSSLCVRNQNLSEFIGKCNITEKELTLRIVQLEKELYQVRNTRGSAMGLQMRIGHNLQEVRYQTITQVLNLVTEGGWL